jgi:hypothetical protein
MLHCQNRFMSDQAMISSSLAKAHSKCRPKPSPLLACRHQDRGMTRRSVFIGAAAALIYAPTIIRATSLMPVAGLPLQLLNPLGEFYRRCFYHSLESDLRVGRSMSTVIDGKIISVAEARRMVAYARVQGWLLPKPLKTMLPWT